MPRRRIELKNIRNLTRTGRNKSVSVTIPIDFIRKLKWQDRQKVVLDLRGETITIKDWKK